MKWPNMPKLKVKRANIERALIGCSAMLVLLLSVQGSDVNMEPYEEPLEEIPVAQTAVSAASAEDYQQTVVYYEDGDGYLVPVQRDVIRQDGIAKATLELMVQSAKNDMDAARLGLVPVVPEGTTFDLDIADGHARVDLGREALSAIDKQQEENMRTAI
ncbi:MAG: GerMN domain-containing protein, partial [Clostridia bacterium]|nr:GerMN domain-containing protein [Clostridia bacterium]